DIGKAARRALNVLAANEMCEFRRHCPVLPARCRSERLLVPIHPPFERTGSRRWRSNIAHSLKFAEWQNHNKAPIHSVC
ncbi:MAG: hypothetical protein AAF844_17255, partial [Pseudomonadota bacterium]